MLLTHYEWVCPRLLTLTCTIPPLPPQSKWPLALRTLNIIHILALQPAHSPLALPQTVRTSAPLSPLPLDLISQQREAAGPPLTRLPLPPPLHPTCSSRKKHRRPLLALWALYQRSETKLGRKRDAQVQNGRRKERGTSACTVLRILS